MQRTTGLRPLPPVIYFCSGLEGVRKGSGHALSRQPSAGEAFCVVVSGRVRCALDRLRRTGAKGCTQSAQLDLELDRLGRLLAALAELSALDLIFFCALRARARGYSRTRTVKIRAARSSLLTG